MRHHLFLAEVKGEKDALTSLPNPPRSIPKSASGKILRRVLRDQKARTDTSTRIQDDVKEKAKL